MDNNMTGLKNIVDSFVSSYAERDKSVEFSVWLAERLQKEMPALSEEAAKNLCADITKGIAEYDQTLASLNNAIKEEGLSKEEWLSERIGEVVADMPADVAGNALSQIECELDRSNTQLMRNIDSEVIDAEFTEVENTDWNSYSVKQKILDVGQQAVLSGLSLSANLIKENLESGEPVTSDAIGQALQDGLETARCEVKAVVAGAVKTAAESGLSDFLPEGTPTETICDMAGAAVETTCALYDAATGKGSMTDAIDIAERASVAMAYRVGMLKLKSVVAGAAAAIPVIGPAVSAISFALLTKLENSTFARETVNAVCDMAKSVRNRIKQGAKNLWNRIKSKASEVFA
jgi:primosomal protein N''